MSRCKNLSIFVLFLLCGVPACQPMTAADTGDAVAPDTGPRLTLRADGVLVADLDDMQQIEQLLRALPPAVERALRQRGAFDTEDRALIAATRTLLTMTGKDSMQRQLHVVTWGGIKGEFKRG